MTKLNLFRYVGISALAVMSAFPAACNSNRLNEHGINWIYDRDKITDVPIYRESDVKRPKVDSTTESWKRLYDSIQGKGFPLTYELNPKEIKYIRWFINQSPEKRNKITNNPKIRRLGFQLGDYSIKDIAFLSHVEENHGLLDKVKNP